MKLFTKKGFTLVELMVVIVIVGILAAVAIPKFTMAQHKAKISEFPTILTQIYTAEGAYEAEAGSYIAVGNSASSEFSDIGATIPSSNYFAYYATIANAGQEMDGIASALSTIGTVVAGNTAAIDENGAKSCHANLLKYAGTWR